MEDNTSIQNGTTRVKLIKMDDPYTDLKQGDEGTVNHIDDTGTIFVNWDNGSTLGLVPDVDEYIVLNEEENQYRPFPKAEDRNTEVGNRNAKLYQQSEEEMLPEDNTETPQHNNNSGEDNDENEPEEEYNPYDGKERRFRISLYFDVHVPMTANLEHDREVAEQEASEILKKINHKSVSNSFLGGVAHNPFGSIPDNKEFDRL